MKEFGSVAERSKALISGTSHFDGVGSNPTAATIVFKKILPARAGNWLLSNYSLF